jgi:hypothetical protein
MAEPAQLLPVIPELLPAPENAGASRVRSGIDAVEPVDENGDTIFHFRITPLAGADQLDVPEVLRQTILDLLQLVRFYSNGKPVIVDSFAFMNEPDKRISLLTGEPEC